MLLGQMPPPSLLSKYDLNQFSEVVQSVKQGNLLRLNSALEKNEKFFIRCGIFLILEKLKIITYRYKKSTSLKCSKRAFQSLVDLTGFSLSLSLRNLFKKVALLMKTHQIPIDAFLAALKMMKVEDIDADETQCIIANLIYEGKIKGYISHQHGKLVVSKQTPFPALASVV